MIRRSSQEQLWTQPPILHVNRLGGSVQCFRDGPEVVSPVNIPLNLVAIANRGEGLKTVRLSNSRALFVGCYLMRFIVPVVWVDEIPKFTDFGTNMVSFLYVMVADISDEIN